MLSDVAHERAQKLLRQRNLFALASASLAVLLMAAASLLAGRDREVLLVPTTRTPLVISSAGVSSEYLEFVTRDVALTLLNRSPEGLDYWMQQILALADPARRGRLKADLMRIVEEQRGSEVTQAFVISKLEVDPKGLTSQVSGTLKTFVGAQVIASEERRFQFDWTYRGLRLAPSNQATRCFHLDQHRASAGLPGLRIGKLVLHTGVQDVLGNTLDRGIGSVHCVFASLDWTGAPRLAASARITCADATGACAATWPAALELWCGGGLPACRAPCRRHGFRQSNDPHTGLDRA